MTQKMNPIAVLVLAALSFGGIGASFLVLFIVPQAGLEFFVLALVGTIVCFFALASYIVHGVSKGMELTIPGMGTLLQGRVAPKVNKPKVPVAKVAAQPVYTPAPAAPPPLASVPAVAPPVSTTPPPVSPRRTIVQAAADALVQHLEHTETRNADLEKLLRESEAARAKLVDEVVKQTVALQQVTAPRTPTPVAAASPTQKRRWPWAVALGGLALIVFCLFAVIIPAAKGFTPRVEGAAQTPQPGGVVEFGEPTQTAGKKSVVFDELTPEPGGVAGTPQAGGGQADAECATNMDTPLCYRGYTAEGKNDGATLWNWLKPEVERYYGCMLTTEEYSAFWKAHIEGSAQRAAYSQDWEQPINFDFIERAWLPAQCQK